MAPALQPLQAAKLADFTMSAALGSGATARVYEAVHAATGRIVAIKMLEPSESGGEMRERFAREAVLLAGLASPHVGAIVGFGFERGQPFLVLERLHGETLDAKLRRDGPIPLEVAVPWIEQLLIGVRDCHDQQIIHRDIKPSNIFLHRENEGDGEEIVKIIDFGVARLRELTGDGGSLTSNNHLIGSMGYMAPEQFKSPMTVDFTADLYAVGVVIFRTLTGRLPFVSRSLEAVIRMKSEQPIPVVSSMPNMPQNPVLDRFVAQTMAREPAHRFQTAGEMLEHWWTVMTSLEPGGSTEVMRGAPLPHEHEVTRASRSSVEPELRAGGSEAEVAYDSEEDRTVRREVRHESAVTVVAGPTEGAEAIWLESSPRTLPLAGASSDQHEVPTRTDPELKRLVARELELHRSRKPPSEPPE